MHEMKLHPAPFEKIKRGEKIFELRLYDEKRQKIKAGEQIVFTNTATGETLHTRVVKLHRFDSFEELYKTLPLLQCGYTAEDIVTAQPSDMEQYYSAEEQKKYGVVGIELFLPRQMTDEAIVKANESNYTFELAQKEDAEQVLSLYERAKSGAFCVWDDSYPTMTEIERDLETENLYVLTDGSNVIGAISVVPENELDGFDCWSCKEGKEIARVVIDKRWQGQGLSFEMVQQVESILRSNGCKAIHLSVVKSNIPAYKTYIKAGFTVVGEAQMYGNDYYLMEKAIHAQ